MAPHETDTLTVSGSTPARARSAPTGVDGTGATVSGTTVSCASAATLPALAVTVAVPGERARNRPSVATVPAAPSTVQLIRGVETALSAASTPFATSGTDWPTTAVAPAGRTTSAASGPVGVVDTTTSPLSTRRSCPRRAG